MLIAHFVVYIHELRTYTTLAQGDNDVLLPCLYSSYASRCATTVPELMQNVLLSSSVTVPGESRCEGRRQ